MSEDKLKNEIAQIKNKISNLELLLESKINREDWNSYKEHINKKLKQLKDDKLSKLEEDIDLLKQHKDDSKERIARLEQSLQELRISIKDLENRIDNVEENILKQVTQNGNATQKNNELINQLLKDNQQLIKDFNDWQSKVKIVKFRTEKQGEDINKLEQINGMQDEKIEENKLDWFNVSKWVIIILLLVISALVGDSISIGDILGGIL